MKLVAARVYSMRIPFKNVFSHSLSTRSCSDSIIVKLTTDTGAIGFGEAIPRPYVTGETVESCVKYLTKELLPHCARYPLPELTGPAAAITLLENISSMLPEKTVRKGIIAMNASRSAVEVACLDAILRHYGKSCSLVVPQVIDTVTYSAVITAGSIETVRNMALRSVRLGIRQVKLKIGKGDALERIAAVREIMGDSVSLRIDANGAFDEYEAVVFIESLEPYHIACIEQPIPRGDIRALARVKCCSSIPVMADESLVVLDDAAELIDLNACDAFNLRISKNGGLYRTMQLAEIARKAGKEIQLGCQVGESAILSAAGRHLAAHFADVRFVEGSYGTLLLEEDVATVPVVFGYGGKASRLTEKGIGITVSEDVLERYAVSIIDVTVV